MKGMFDRKKWFWKRIEDTVLLCSAGPSGGGIKTLKKKIKLNL